MGNVLDRLHGLHISQLCVRNSSELNGMVPVSPRGPDVAGAHHHGHVRADHQLGEVSELAVTECEGLLAIGRIDDGDEQGINGGYAQHAKRQNGADQVNRRTG